MAVPKNIIFADIDFSFKRHPVTNDIGKLTNEEAVKRSIKNLVMTKVFERPFRTDLGSKVYSSLFEPFGPLTENVLFETIKNTLENNEPRMIINSIEILPNINLDGYDITINFNIINNFEELEVDFFLKRLK